MRVAIVGAGIAGLTCARRLVDSGADVTVLDKARGPGGRLATRRLDDGQADLGAQYFTAHEPGFAEQVAHWERRGLVARWTPRIVRLDSGAASRSDDRTPRWVGVPRMSALTRHMALALGVQTESPVTGLGGAPGAWRVDTGAGSSLGPFERLVLALPAPQAAALLEPIAPDFAARAAERPMAGCWAAALDVGPDGPAFDAAFVHDAPVRWLARDGSKPGRPAPGIWVAHATPDWSDERIELAPEEVLPLLVEAFREASGHAGAVRGLVAHRWRYARGARPAEDEFLLDAERGLAACGDWCLDSRVEGAWHSGDRLARALVARPG